MQWIEFEISETAAVRDAQREFQRAQSVARHAFLFHAWAEGPAAAGLQRWRVDSQFIDFLSESQVRFKPISGNESRSAAR